MERFKREHRIKSFIQSIVPIWNELPEKITKVDTAMTFKRYFNRSVDSKRFGNYGLNADKCDQQYANLFGVNIVSHRAYFSAVYLYLQ